MVKPTKKPKHNTIYMNKYGGELIILTGKVRVGLDIFLEIENDISKKYGGLCISLQTLVRGWEFLGYL